MQDSRGITCTSQMICAAALNVVAQFLLHISLGSFYCVVCHMHSSLYLNVHFHQNFRLLAPVLSALFLCAFHAVFLHHGIPACTAFPPGRLQ